MSEAARSPRHIEAEIEATRDRLAATIDELAYRAQPKVIAERQKEAAQVKLRETFYTADGDLRIDRVAIIAGVVGLLVAISVARRVRR